MTGPSVDDPFTAVLEAEHSAIYGYGILGARLDRNGKTAARAAETTHRDRRDWLMNWYEERGKAAAPAAAAYTLAAPVTDVTSARQTAIAIEEHCAREWRLALAHTNGDDRKVALDALIACAVQATRWREAAGTRPATVAFPGSPA